MKNTTHWFRPAAAATSAVILGLSLAACSSGNSEASNRPENEVHVLVYGDAGNTVEQAMVDTFNETSDVKVILDTIPGAEYQSKLQTIIDTDSAPDVFFNWGGGSITDYVDAGLLMPLDDFIAEDSQLKDAFLPSVFDAAVVDDTAYGIPMRGTQPVMLFSNEEVLASAGIEEAPETWDDLLADVEKLKAAGVTTPIALGGADEWPTLMWVEYVYDRVAGPELFEAALGGDPSVWESDESREALGMLKELVDTGAFGNNYQSVKFTDGGSASLLSGGQAGFELMGSWAYSTHRDAAPEFAANSLGYSEFPAVDGGKGDPANLVGNTNNFYSVLANTRYPDTVRDFLKLMYSDQFVQEQVAIGNLPTTTNTSDFLDEATNPDYAKYQLSLVEDAPSFQLSWDQAYPPSATPAIHGAMADFFSGRIDEDGFIAAMQGL